jgi:hypothetical protein
MTRSEKAVRRVQTNVIVGLVDVLDYSNGIIVLLLRAIGRLKGDYDPTGKCML